MNNTTTPADILRHAEQLGWAVTEARAGEIAGGVKAAYDHLARAAAKLDFDIDTQSLFAAREACREMSSQMGARRAEAANAPRAAPTKAFQPPVITARAPLHVTLTQAARALRERSVSSVELTQAAISAAKALQPQLNAFVRLDEEAALATARACDADLKKGKLRGVLHGVPLAHKDMYYRKGQVATCGSRIRKDWIAPTTASALERLDAAGAVQIGNLNMTEFAYGPTGQNAFLGDARNPWNTGYITGGSSSGSGVSVAARIVYGALGSDTGGSVRLPASICGVTGMKTTFGLVSRAGAMPLSQYLDTVGPLTRTVADNALMLSVLAGHDARDPSTVAGAVPDYMAQLTRPVNGLRIGVPKGYFDAMLEPAVAERMAAAFEVYRKLGCELVEVSIPDMDAANAAGFLLTWGDVIGIHGEWMRTRPDDYTPQTRGRIQMTLGATVQGVAAAQRVRGPMLREFCAAVFDKCDALLAPVLSFEVPKLSDVDVSGGPNMMRILNEITRLMRPINVLGLPALSVPAGFTANGMPCGFQLIGRPFAEARLYQLGHAYESATGYTEHLPAVHSN